jgi:hypothetical protein
MNDDREGTRRILIATFAAISEPVGPSTMRQFDIFKTNGWPNPSLSPVLLRAGESLHTEELSRLRDYFAGDDELKGIQPYFSVFEDGTNDAIQIATVADNNGWQQTKAPLIVNIADDLSPIDIGVNLLSIGTLNSGLLTDAFGTVIASANPEDVAEDERFVDRVIDTFSKTRLPTHVTVLFGQDGSPFATNLITFGQDVAVLHYNAVRADLQGQRLSRVTQTASFAFARSHGISVCTTTTRHPNLAGKWSRSAQLATYRYVAP